MNFTLLKEFFAGFLRTRHIARHFRRLAMLETMTDASVSREVPPTLAQTLVVAANSSANAVALIIGHNHPSGDLTPSTSDLKLTKRLRQAAELLGIKRTTLIEKLKKRSM